jgi:hypothetical protein
MAALEESGGNRTHAALALCEAGMLPALGSTARNPYMHFRAIVDLLPSLAKQIDAKWPRRQATVTPASTMGLVQKMLATAKALRETVGGEWRDRNGRVRRAEALEAAAASGDVRRARKALCKELGRKKIEAAKKDSLTVATESV